MARAARRTLQLAQISCTIFALRDREVGAAADAHQRGIEGAVVADVVKQPGVLDVDFGRRQLLELGVVGLHAVHVLDGARGIAGGGVEAGLGLDEVDVGIKLLAHRRRNVGDLLERLRVAIGGGQGVDEAFPGIGAVGVVGEHLAVDGVGLVSVVAQQIDGSQLQLKGDAGLAAGCDLEFFRALQQPLGNFKLVGLLIDGSEHGQEAGIAQRGFVGGRGHLLHVADGL